MAQYMESISTLGNESLIIGGDFNEIYTHHWIPIPQLMHQPKIIKILQII